MALCDGEQVGADANARVNTMDWTSRAQNTSGRCGAIDPCHFAGREIAARATSRLPHSDPAATLALQIPLSGHTPRESDHVANAIGMAMPAGWGRGRGLCARGPPGRG